MPSLNTIKNQFFNDIFDSKSEIDMTSEINTRIGELLPTKHVKASVKLNNIIKAYIYRIQYMMIGQDEETQKDITAIAIKELIHFLKFIFNHLHPGMEAKVEEEYWQKVKQTLRDCIVEDFDANKIKEYVEMKEFSICLMTQTHPFLSSHLRTNMIYFTKKFKLDDKAKAIVDTNAKYSVENVRQITANYTDYNIPYFFSGVLAGVGAASWYYGMPYLSYIIGTIDLIGSSAYATIKPKLKSKAEEYFYKEGIKHHEKLTGEKLPPMDKVSSINKQNLIRYGISTVTIKASDSFKFAKKSIPAQTKDEKPRETYVSTYESNYSFFSGFTQSNLTETQRKKNKPQRPMQEPVSFKTINPEDDLRTTKTRIIELPKNVDGQVFEGTNGSLMLLLAPTANSKITREDLKEVMGARKDNSYAKSHGQSGPKLSTNGMFTLKNKFTKERFELEKQVIITAKVDGIPQSIPVYQPVRRFFKRK